MVISSTEWCAITNDQFLIGSDLPTLNWSCDPKIQKAIEPSQYASGSASSVPVFNHLELLS